LNFVYLRSSRLKVLHFWLDSCIANKGEKFELVLACWMLLEGFQVVSSHFWALVCTGLTGRGHRVLFIPSCPGYTGLTGALDRSVRCTPWWVFARVNVWVSLLLSCVGAVSSLGQFGGRLTFLAIWGL
jgi:hypothetical protein